MWGPYATGHTVLNLYFTSIHICHSKSCVFVLLLFAIWLSIPESSALRLTLVGNIRWASAISSDFRSCPSKYSPECLRAMIHYRVKHLALQRKKALDYQGGLQFRPEGFFFIGLIFIFNAHIVHYTEQKCWNTNLYILCTTAPSSDKPKVDNFLKMYGYCTNYCCSI